MLVVIQLARRSLSAIR